MFISKEKSNNLLRLNDKNVIKKDIITHQPSVIEWCNSLYSFNKKNININKTNITHNIISSYFNSQPIGLNKDKIKLSSSSLKKIYISKPEIKHSINEVVITVYSFNKYKLYLLNKVKKLNKLFNKQSMVNKKIKYKNNLIFKLKIWSFISRFINNGIVSQLHINSNKYRINKFIYYFFNKVTFYNFNYKNSSVINKLIIRIFKKKLRKVYLYKYYTIMLYVNNLKYNVSNTVGLINILSKFYNKKVIFNVVSLKYLYLENYNLVDAVARKLKDRKNKVLKVLRQAMKLIKKAKLHYYLLIPNREYLLIPDKFKLKKLKSNNSNVLYSYINNNHNLAFEGLNNKYLTGIKLQASGRLTKRLTASRTMLKNTHKGSLKNINSSIQKMPTVLLKGYSKSNIKYLGINSKNRNGSFGIKGWSSSY